MGCGRAVAIATRGYICQSDDVPIVIPGLSPEVLASVLEPNVQLGGKPPPEFVVKSVEIEPQPICLDQDLFPTLRVTYVPAQVPDAKPKKPKKTPSGKIRPIDDLTPKIVKKKDD